MSNKYKEKEPIECNCDEPITFSRLSTSLKFAVVGGWIILISMLLSFIAGMIEGLSGL